MASLGPIQQSLSHSHGDFQEFFAGYRREWAQKTESQLSHSSQRVRGTA